MLLDRCVVLFDEIDELIQDRTSEESDPFGRFLTTSMLPKIAKLWKQRRVVFFVATNHVSRADPAITRTSRFDARIFVAPPGLAVKRRELSNVLGSEAPVVDDSTVALALSKDEKDRKGLSQNDLALGVLPLLRYDQVPELIRRLRETGEPSKAENLTSALDEMRIALLHHEWQPATQPDKWKEMGPDDRLRFVLQEYRDDESRDFARRRVVRVELQQEQDLPVNRPRIDGDHHPGDEKAVYFEAPEDLSELRHVDGELRIGEGDGFADGGLLLFRRVVTEDDAEEAVESTPQNGAASSGTEIDDGLGAKDDPV
jgi:SpoVK/Ycf46/Vps4 family AAA+-type ATPase